MQSKIESQSETIETSKINYEVQTLLERSIGLPTLSTMQDLSESNDSSPELTICIDKGMNA